MKPWTRLTTPSRVELRNLYGRFRLCFDWRDPRGVEWEVYVDVDRLNGVVHKATKNAGHSARSGPVSVRRLDRHRGATGLRKGGSGR